MKRTISLFCVGALLTACGSTPPPEPIEPPPPIEKPPVVEEPEVRETRNVAYKGIVKPAGISIYMQGSHRLVLSDGRFILLESDTVDLNGYVNEEVEVIGALRPTVEAGSMIMRVEQISLIKEATEPEGDEEIEEEGIEEETIEVEESSETEDVEDVEEVEQIIEDAKAEEEEALVPTNPDLEERIALMAKEDFSASNWTQQYCTGHIGFCVPVHRNWWFKSFGTTTSYLWHVEVSSEEVDGLYHGPIRINLVSGTVASKKAVDGQIRATGNTVTGFIEWTENRHFEITADVRLEGAVKYMTENVVAYED